MLLYYYYFFYLFGCNKCRFGRVACVSNVFINIDYLAVCAVLTVLTVLTFFRPFRLLWHIHTYLYKYYDFYHVYAKSGIWDATFAKPRTQFTTTDIICNFYNGMAPFHFFHAIRLSAAYRAFRSRICMLLVWKKRNHSARFARFFGQSEIIRLQCVVFWTKYNEKQLFVICN